MPGVVVVVVVVKVAVRLSIDSNPFSEYPTSLSASWVSGPAERDLSARCEPPLSAPHTSAAPRSTASRLSRRRAPNVAATAYLPTEGGGCGCSCSSVAWSSSWSSWAASGTSAAMASRTAAVSAEVTMAETAAISSPRVAASATDRTSRRSASTSSTSSSGTPILSSSSSAGFGIDETSWSIAPAFRPSPSPETSSVRYVSAVTGMVPMPCD